jgi:transposase-like protein
MPKMRSLLWIIHAGGYWTAAKLAKFTTVSPTCPQCGTEDEMVKHALVDCPLIRQFWQCIFDSL